MRKRRSSRGKATQPSAHSDPHYELIWEAGLLLAHVCRLGGTKNLTLPVLLEVIGGLCHSTLLFGSADPSSTPAQLPPLAPVTTGTTVTRSGDPPMRRKQKISMTAQSECA